MPKNKYYWEFSIVKWDETGNVLLEHHHMIVQRQRQDTAAEVVRRKYRYKDGYDQELNDMWVKFPDGSTTRYIRNSDGVIVPHETNRDKTPVNQIIRKNG